VGGGGEGGFGRTSMRGPHEARRVRADPRQLSTPPTQRMRRRGAHTMTWVMHAQTQHSGMQDNPCTQLQRAAASDALAGAAGRLATA
jgi:hypothetical protein